jgi:hypothetical protein
LRTLLLSALLIAIPAFARVATNPSAPTSAGPVELIVHGPCGSNGHANRAPFVVSVYLRPPAQPCDPPLTTLVVPLGRVPVGEYRVNVRVDGSNAITESGSFVVRDGRANVATMQVHPFVVPANTEEGALVTVLSNGPLCNPKCPLIAVDDFYLPPDQVSGDEHTLTFRAPEHEPGLVDVKVNGAFITLLPGALYYFDRNAEPLPSVFERVLFPVLFRAAGANGSQWISEAAVANTADWPIPTFNTLGDDGYPRGVALLVPAGESDRLAFSLRVRDLTQDSFGTEVPVVRERDLVMSGELTLLDVPIDPRYRTKLRLYAFDDQPSVASVLVHDETLSVPMSRECSGLACAWTPYTGEVDVPPGGANELAAIYVSVGGPGVPAWAFASITNNETQHVTIVAPDGKGGRPCNPCEVP